MSDVEPSQIISITRMRENIKSNKEDIQENKEAIQQCNTNTQDLRDIVIETKAYQKATHDDVVSIKEGITAITKSLPYREATHPTPTSPLLAQPTNTDWGEWLMKNLVLILAVLICSTITGVVVHLITSALSK